MNINDILSSLDLDNNEVKTYLLLLETGPITVGELAKKLGLPRPSLYGFLKRLRDQGLINESIKYSIKTFSAEPPEKVNFLFAQRIEDLQKKQQLFKEVLPELKKQQPSKWLTPKLQLFEGEDGLKNILKDMLLYSNMETQAFWPQKKMVDILSPDFFRYHNKERIRNNLYTRAIWPESQMVNIKDHPYFGVGEKFKREIRIAPTEVNFSMGYWIYGSKVAFISSRKESFGFIIESAELVETLLAQFEIVWKISKPLVVDEKDTQSFIKEL
jgi:sugar-specific transcriptional regulator TrmB